MANPVKQGPEIMIIATGPKAIHAKFGGWPDILQAESAALDLTIPVYEQLPLAQWQQAIRAAAEPYLPSLRSAAGKLRQVWSGQAGTPAWDKVAHSLLVNYLLWGVGGQVLLKLYGASVATVLVETPGDSSAIWQGFVRYNQQYGVSCLLGNQYENSMNVRDLLNKPDVVKTMATLAANRRLAVSETSARRILSRMSAIDGNRADDGTEKTTWPVLTAKDLRAVQASLLTVTRALLPLLRQALAPVVEDAKTSREQYTVVDLALVGYGLLVRTLADDWLEVGLLPPVVHPILNV